MRRLKKLGYYLSSVINMTIHFKNWLLIWPIFLKNRHSKLHEVQLRQPPVRMKFRGRMDLWSVKETFLDAFYTRYGVEIQDGWTIIDIGAGIGDFSIYAAYGNPHAVIYAVEPFADSFQLLIENLTLNAVDNVIAFQSAIWGHSGELKLDFSRGEPLQIVSQGVEKTKDDAALMPVQAISLEDFLSGQGIEQVDLLKMDCEGAEYEILLHASSPVIQKIDRLVMEYHDLSAGRDHQVLLQFLEEEGFHVTKHANIVHDDIGYLFASRRR